MLYLLYAAIQIERLSKRGWICAPLWSFLKLGKQSPGWHHHELLQTLPDCQLDMGSGN